MTRIITIASGESGAGKTAIAINLATQLAQHNRRVCLLDADWGLLNAHQMLGLEPQYTLRELLLGEATLEQVLVRDSHGFDVVPGYSGDSWMTTLSTAQLFCLADALREMDDYDVILIDAASTMARHVQAFLLASPEVLLVITPQPSALTEAYALLKLIHAEHYDCQIHLVVNLARNHTVGRHTYDKFREIADFYLSAQLPLSGILGDDPQMSQAVQAQQPLVSCYPDSLAARDIRQLAEQLLSEPDAGHATGMQDFIAHYLRASGVVASEATAAMGIGAAADRVDEDLQQQIDGLSTRVNLLIAENQRLRGAAEPHADLYMLPRAGKRTTPERCNEVCVAMNTRAEQVTVQGETFSIYHMPRSNGDQQRFACHSLDDDLQEPESQSTSP